VPAAGTRSDQASVTASSTVRVALELEQTADTVSGRMTVGNGPPTSFFGWLELIGLLDSLTHAAGDEGSAGPPSGPHLSQEK
jgi:hypothetical protein